MVFGSVHALLIDDLTLQTVVLGIIEVGYFSAKAYAIRSLVTKYRFKVVMLSVASLLRMVLIVTLYLYEKEGHPFVINLVHHDLVWTYLICWAVESVYDIVVFLGDIIEAIKMVTSK